MDELTDQLRSLGEATERAVAKIEVDQAPSQADVIDIGTGGPSAPKRAARRVGSRRRISGRALVAIAAAIVALAAGSMVLINRNDRAAELETASSGRTAQTDGASSEPFDDNGWADLRDCESDGNYSADSGNTFYGAYQISQSSWNDAADALGKESYVAKPSDAPPEIQDAFANALYLADGADPWPVCGRHLKGPMITPVIGEWLEGPDTIDVSVIVFLNPDATAAEIADVRSILDTELTRRVLPPSELTSVTFVDKEEAYEEFLEIEFGEQVRDSVRVSDMPPSFRIQLPRSGAEVPDTIRDHPAVFEVVTAAEGLSWGTGRPLRLLVPTLGIDVPIFNTPTIDNLEQGVSRQVAARSTTVILGQGVGPAAPFASLDQLRTGDIIEIETLLSAVGGVTSTQRLQVIERTDTAATFPLFRVSELGDWQRRLDGRTVLVANVPGDPDERVVITATPVELEASLYGDSAE